MNRRLTVLCILTLLIAAPATPFWGAFFSSLGNAVGSAFGFSSGGLNASGLMPVTVKAAKPVVDAARERLAELQRIHSMASETLDHYSGLAGTLRDLGSLQRFRAETTNWLRTTTANRFGTSGAWTRALNGESSPSATVAAYSAAGVAVPDWSAALPSLPGPWQDGVRREHATLELADAASVRSLTVLGELRRLAPERRRANGELEASALNPANAAQAMPAAADYRTEVAAAPAPNWRMP